MLATAIGAHDDGYSNTSVNGAPNGSSNTFSRYASRQGINFCVRPTSVCHLRSLELFECGLGEGVRAVVLWM
jgi:hypothetical protein